MDNRPQDNGLQASLLRFITHGSSLSKGKRRALYVGVALAALTIIWLPVGLFLAVKTTTYTSKWDLILPGSGAGLAVSLESVGQASASAASPYASHSVDPKVNYKAIAESEPVLSAAAAQMEMSVRSFGIPRIKLVDQTALMHFSITAPTAEQANCKAQALHHALQSELERLRADEMQQRDEAVNRVLRSYNETLHQAQQNILDYQASSRIISLEQFAELTMNLERLRVKLGEMKAEHASVSGNIESLQQSLDTTARVAAALHTLQQDALFQELADKWATAASSLSETRSKWGERHPEVVTARDAHNRLRNILHKRARKLVPDSNMDPDKLVALGTSNASLYTQLVDLTTRENGLRKQIITTEENLNTQQKFLEESTTDASNLEDLKRKHQVATAVMTTALAKLDMGKSDHFSSYPLLQILAQPTMPEKPDSLARSLALIGALFATLVSIFGLLLLWIRKPYLQKLLKSA
jgi:capsule polysaccharide export protein KpsE/RkpR